MKVVIDTNVLVFALLTRDGTCGQVIQLAYQKLITWQIDRRILDEYQEMASFEIPEVDPILSPGPKA